MVWIDGSLGDSEYLSAMQYLVGARMIKTSTQTNAQPNFMPTNAFNVSIVNASSSDEDLAKCDSATIPAADRHVLRKSSLQENCKQRWQEIHMW